MNSPTDSFLADGDRPHGRYKPADSIPVLREYRGPSADTPAHPPNKTTGGLSPRGVIRLAPGGFWTGSDPRRFPLRAPRSPSPAKVSARHGIVVEPAQIRVAHPQAA